MAKHHYLPATYLARFSNDKKLPTRDRKLAVGDNWTGRIFKLSAENAGCEGNFYYWSSNEKDPELIEKIWQDYETHLNNAIVALIRMEVTAIVCNTSYELPDISVI